MTGVEHQARFQSDYEKVRFLLLAGKLSHRSVRDWLSYRNTMLISQLVAEGLKPYGRRVERELEGLEEDKDE